MTTRERSEFRWLARETKPYLKLQIASLLLITFGSLLYLLDPLVMKWLIDEVLPHRDRHGLVIALILIFLAYEGRATCASFGGNLNFIASQRFMLDLRMRLLNHLASLSSDHHETTPVGTTLYILRDTIQDIGILGSDLFPSVLRTMITGLTILGAMFMLNSGLATVTLPLVPLFLFVNRSLRRRLRLVTEEAQAAQANASALLQEQVAGMIQTRLLLCERTQARRAFRCLSAGVRTEHRRKAADIRYNVFSTLILVSGIMTILGCGGLKVLSGTLSMGGLVAFYGYLVRLFDPLYSALEMGSRFQRVGASIGRVMEAFAITSSVRDTSGAKELPASVEGAIEFRSVSFAYQPGKPVLRDVGLSIGPRERAALVGPSGSGKSTVAKLMARLYEPDLGLVLLNNCDVRHIRLRSLRSCLAYMPQHPILFDCTLEDNLRLANPAASARELSGAAEIVELGSTIANLPGNWKEPLGPGGNRLSGGERQRLALARTILQNPKVLILDEATSALDASSERRVLERLELALPSTTIVFITHRLSTITWAHQILVVDNGRLVETGKHADLYARGGLYTQLYDHQAATDHYPAGLCP